MSPPVPTTSAVAAQIVAQMEAALSQSVPLLPKAFIRVLAKALAGVVVLLYKYAGWVFLQIFVAHASFEESTINGKKIRPLVEWGRLIGVGDPGAATHAEIVVRVVVTAIGGSLKAGSQLLRTETGVIYTVAADTLLNAATVPVTIRAASQQNGGSGEGTIGNLQPGDIVSFANPLGNVATDATVEAIAVAGVEAETEDAYRARVIRKFQRKPQGGSLADYREWAEEVAGVANVYPYGGAPGQVDVFVESTTGVDGVPSGPLLTAVMSSIQRIDPVSGLATRRPAGAAINVLPISRVPFAVTIGGLTPDTLETRAEIRGHLEEYLLSREPFVIGLSELPAGDCVSLGAVSGIVDDVVNAAGASVTYVEMVPMPTEGGPFKLGPGQKAKLAGEPNYV